MAKRRSDAAAAEKFLGAKTIKAFEVIAAAKFEIATASFAAAQESSSLVDYEAALEKAEDFRRALKTLILHKGQRVYNSRDIRNRRAEQHDSRNQPSDRRGNAPSTGGHIHHGQGQTRTPGSRRS